MTTSARVVRCAECGSSYRLPERLMGPRGARVRCRECGARFDVARGEDPEAAAREIVEGLADRVPVWLQAQARGALFAEAGEALLAAFDRWRERAGPAADPAVFRAALGERWNLVVPGHDPAREP